MDITKLISLIPGLLIIIILLRKVNQEFAFFAACVINISITVFSLAIIIPVFEYIENLSVTGIYTEFVKVMFKSAGVCLMCTIASELCRDCNETSLSSRIEFAAKCTLISFSLPLLIKVFDYAKTFLS